ncbi:MAG: hypothetical protein Q9M89_01520 [Persephonella sp.]|nr:hypothetical protein [Persephonella sp.]
MRFEHIEYINNLWGKELKEVHYLRICQIYEANRKFSHRVFDKQNLLLVYTSLKRCGKYDETVELAKIIYKRWKDDKSLLLLSDAYFSAGKYRKSVDVLKKIKIKNCDYFILSGKNSIFLRNGRPELADRILSSCRKENVENM